MTIGRCNRTNRTNKSNETNNEEDEDFRQIFFDLIRMASKGKKVSSKTQSLPIVTDPEMAERFERELNWCCQQLESMIRVSSSSKEKEPRKFSKIESFVVEFFF